MKLPDNFPRGFEFCMFAEYRLDERPSESSFTEQASTEAAQASQVA